MRTLHAVGLTLMGIMGLAPCGCASHRVPTVITDILHRQTSAWNRGDVEAFMEPYWRSDELMFVSGGKVTKGWQETLAGYRQRYPTRAEMGRLTFSELEVRELAPRAALVLGRWHLQRDAPADDVGGRFTLLFRRMGGEWLIVYDHTSRD